MGVTDTTTPEMPESIYAWGHWNAGSVTGEWSANTHDRDDGQDYIRSDLIGVSLSAPAPAATPDLRDVVRELVDALTFVLPLAKGYAAQNNHAVKHECIEIARAAIAKAEGVL